VVKIERENSGTKTNKKERITSKQINLNKREEKI
jgi:hypothetical protein